MFEAFLKYPCVYNLKKWATDGVTCLIIDGEEIGDSKCIVRMTSHNVSRANCAVCSNSLK